MFETPEIAIEYTLDKRINKRINIFWLGFTIYTAVFAIGAALTRTYSINPILQLIGFCLMLLTAAYLIQFRIEDNYLKAFFFLFFCWLLCVILRGSRYDSPYLQFLLFNGDFGVLPYFVPLILLFPRDLVFYKKIFDVITVLGILFIVYDIVFIKVLLNPDRTSNLIYQNSAERFIKCLSFPVGFLLFTFSYHSKKRRLFAIVIILINLLIAIYRARRGLILLTSTTLLIFFVLYFASSRKKVLLVFISVILAFVAARFVSTYSQREDSIFDFLSERANEDTRNPVEQCFYSDLKTRDWIVGKGLNGDYFCPIIDEDDVTGYRDAIETDYLNIILKGGLVSLGLLMLILVPAIFLGLLYSRNTLSKAAALWIALWIVSLYPSNVTTFSLNYFLVWISVGICYSKSIRNMSDEVLKEYFRAKTT
jgi:hypothetical protein